ncbi:RimK family alpha-L-glutamate ligase [Candidatus Borkfalkia ceftriaxoniphila]|uniref:RimK family alpha-L-glutamate ligase n=1 Tax=Candidatus Borkfalkia ceftriaxoniphila TaxID=2508949 RepID=A0A4Q2K7P8_9FIRM|nr:RimK family alpha-L-glutamate ligase [Candidatus Borkfalkia ceftriaxoniphila]RXZ58043.1 RimK family alpha-L-glutamate ligase [Candidatus Borkfalkia ceftriaxoniphila]
MKGIVLLNAYTKSAGANRQASRIAEELNALGVQTEMRLNGAFDADIFSSRVRLAQKPDFVVYLDKDKYLSRLWEKEGVRLFNSADGVEVCDDKMLTYIALANGGVEIPDTLPAPLCYYPDARVREEYCRVVEERLGYPLVVKKSFGSWGMDVNLIQNFAELTKIAEEYKLFPHLYQKYIAAKRGEDTRVLVIGGKAVAAMRRRNDGDFRSNIELGGRGYPAEITKSYREISERAARLLSLDYCGIDLLEGEDGRPIVCEVNSNAFFNEAEKVTGVNIAGAYAAHIAREMKKN